MLRFIAALTITFGAIGCTQRDEQPEPSRGELRQDSVVSEAVSGVTHVNILSCESLETEIIDGPPSRATFRRLHGAPDSVTAWTEPNRHIEGAIDSLFTVYYPGFRASFRVPPSGNDLIAAASITDNRYIRDPGLGIGAREADVLARLGEPTRREDGDLVYECGMGAEQPVTFQLSNGVVSAIAITFYVD